jgi:integrase
VVPSPQLNGINGPDRPHREPGDGFGKVSSRGIAGRGPLRNTEDSRDLREPGQVPHIAERSQAAAAEPTGPELVYDVDSLSNSASASPCSSTPIASLVEAHDHYLRRQGRADRTRQKYGHVLGVFADWLGAQPVGRLAAGDIDLFLAGWEAAFERREGRPLSRATARGRIAALRSFFEYLDRFGLLVDAFGAPARNPMRAIVAPPVEQRPNDFLTQREDAALLLVRCAPHERIIVWTLRWTGLRVSELCALTVGDLNLAAGREAVRVLKSKTSAGCRSVPLAPDLVPELVVWLEALHARGLHHASTPFLATSSGRAMTPTFVWRIVKRVAARAGIRVVPCLCQSRAATRHAPACPRGMNGEHCSEVSPHTLRRTYASDLLNRGMRIETLSTLLGHSTIGVTQKAYAQLLGTTVRDELLAALGRDLTQAS